MTLDFVYMRVVCVYEDEGGMVQEGSVLYARKDLYASNVQLRAMQQPIHSISTLLELSCCTKAALSVTVKILS